jgi:hypothetical protein
MVNTLCTFVHLFCSFVRFYTCADSVVRLEGGYRMVNTLCTFVRFYTRDFVIFISDTVWLIRQHPKLETPGFVPAIIRGSQLEQHDSEHNPLGHWFVAKEFINFPMFFLNVKSSRIMRLVFQRPNEIILVLWDGNVVVAC